ncbi:MAG TPA: hypothetical protein VGR40_00855, partial [Candidatus Binatus sp.]|nr:hypothetical protein [Candidatus Binatus sp.]
GARVDMTLTLFLEIAFFEFILIAEDLTSRRMLLYLAIAFAVLSKGPVGIVLPALVGLIWIVLMRRWDLLRKLRPIRGALLVAIIGGGWYVAAFWIGGADFFRKQIIAENFVRFTGGPGFHEGHAHPFFYVELALLAGFMPWTVLLPTVAAVAAWRPMKVTPRLAYLMVWFATVLIFYNLAHSKRGVYLLALYPALATIIAVYLADVLADSAPFRRVISITSGVAEVALIALGVSGLIGLATLVAMPSAMHEFLKLFAIDAPMFVPMLASSVHQHWMLAAALPLACEALGLLLAHHHQSLERVLAVTTGAVICVGIAANLIVVPAMADTLALKDFAHDVLNKVGSSRLGYLGALNYDFAFYSGGTYPIVRARDAELPDYLLAWDSIFASLPLEQRAKFTVVIESNPTSLDGSDQLMLLRRGAPPATPAGPPKGELETRYDSDDFRRSAIAVTSLGRTFADPPRRLKSQILVISDS